MILPGGVVLIATIPQSALRLTARCGEPGRGSGCPQDSHSLPRLRFAYPLHKGAFGGRITWFAIHSEASRKIRAVRESIKANTFSARRRHPNLSFSIYHSAFHLPPHTSTRNLPQAFQPGTTPTSTRSHRHSLRRCSRPPYLSFIIQHLSFSIPILAPVSGPNLTVLFGPNLPPRSRP